VQLPHIQFDSAQAATTAYYPSDGVGGYTATASDTYANRWDRTELRRFIMPTANVDHVVEFYHESGDLAAKFRCMAGGASEGLDLKWDAGEGPVMLGAWYVEFPAVTAEDFIFVQFQRVQ